VEGYGILPYTLRSLGDFSMTAVVSTARLEARISTDLHALLKRAAEIEGRTITDFVIQAVQASARQTVQQAEWLQLTLNDQTAFAEALLTPPLTNAALERAFERRREIFGA
jgi:uncharacterized protein (DUF1778 family)